MRRLRSDPSAADFWRTAFYLGLARFAVEMLLVVAIFFILKPRLEHVRLYERMSRHGQRRVTNETSRLTIRSYAINSYATN